MTLVLTEGFDVGDWATKWINSAIDKGSSFGFVAFGGGRCFKRAAPASGGYIYHAFTASATVVVGVRVYYTANYSGFPHAIFSLYGDANTTEHVSLATGDSNDTLTVRRGTTVLATFAANRLTWMYLECKFTIADSGGLAEVKKDGAVVATFSGDTKNGGTNVSVDTIRLGASTNNTGIDSLVDDMYILNSSGSVNNDYLGDVRVTTLLPSGAGASTQWTPSTGSNYDNVNDIPHNIGTYNASGTAGQRDTYDMPALSVAAGGPIVGGTITASSTYSTETASKSADGLFSTGWTSNGVAANSWLMWDLGSDQPVTGYMMGAGAGTAGSVARSIASWKIQGATSAAPSTWVDLDTRAYAWAVGEVFNWLFSSTQTYRYFRILVVAGGVGNDGYVGTSEFWLFGPNAGAAVAVKAVQVTAIVAKNDGGSASHKIAVKSSSTVAYGSTRATPASAVGYSEMFETDPNTSAAWSDSAVGAMEIGIEAA